MNPAISFRNLTLSYGSRRVFAQLTGDIEAGSFVGVLGPNGAGKSTLLKAIAGLVRPTEGAVEIDGKPIRRRTPLIGYVPQAVHMDEDVPLTGRDLVGLGLDGHRLGFPLPSRARREAIEAALAEVNALHLADRRIGRLSGGERQRLLIAQAIVSRPRVLLLDEPLNNLDLASTQQVVDLVKRLAHEGGMAVLLVAHDVNPLIGRVDQILYLANGRMAMGTIDQVLRPEVLSGLYGYPVEVLRAGGRIIVAAGAMDGHAHAVSAASPEASVVLP
ncbi:metal ABC transporter ATP-binding protein [Alicyclobacillus vulcanalis]|uniref:Zinc/manganese transport system ATP-binding protein n=1 Tax=Alicyclobacillus vulcanalis TaxID=252246 RepID=A0A1N7JL82_9BACL|nr:metal ABC transporter ATP-binding protein [Alicyclobacillus vulcanalis]SIS50016.1 zinc/manganese transport system ATP-binding protein [Alicyclobacillus vulcanalis]